MCVNTNAHFMFLIIFDYIRVLFDNYMYMCNYAGHAAFSMASNVTLDRIGANGEFDLISMYSKYANVNDTEDGDSPFQFNSSNCSYCEPPDF